MKCDLVDTTIERRDEAYRERLGEKLQQVSNQVASEKSSCSKYEIEFINKL